MLLEMRKQNWESSRKRMKARTTTMGRYRAVQGHKLAARLQNKIKDYECPMIFLFHPLKFYYSMPGFKGYQGVYVVLSRKIITVRLQVFYNSNFLDIYIYIARLDHLLGIPLPRPLSTRLL